MLMLWNPELQVILLKDMLTTGDLYFDSALDGSPLFQQAYVTLTGRAVRLLKQHACTPLSTWPLSTRGRLGKLVEKPGLSPSRYLKLLDLPKTPQSLQVYRVDEQRAVLCGMLDGVGTGPTALPWLRTVQSLASGELQASMLLYHLNSRGGGSIQLRFEEWLKVASHRCTDLEQYGAIIKKHWPTQLNFSNTGSDRWDFLDCDSVSDVVYGPKSEDWSLKVTHCQVVSVYQLCRPPASWPEPAFLPQTTLEDPSQADELRGNWVLIKAVLIEGQHQIHARSMVHVCADLCNSTQDDSSLLALVRRDHVVSSTAESRGRRRSRSQPAQARYFAQANDVMYRHVLHTQDRLKRSLLWGNLTATNFDTPITPSIFEGVRSAWRERMRQLSDRHDWWSIPWLADGPYALLRPAFDT